MIEYRWREVRDTAFFFRFPIQRNLPVQSLKYSLKTPTLHFIV